MPRFFAVIGAVLALALAASGASAADALSTQQRGEVEKLVREYILAHPEILLEAIERLEDRRAEGDLPASEALAAARTQVFKDPETPVANPSGAVPVVEFFDYRCGYCKKMLSDVRRLRQENQGVRLIFKDLPILGPDSVIAARAALASRAQGKYEAYHFALMDTRGAFTEERVLAIAKEVGLDIERLKRDMQDPKIQAQIDSNIALAQQLNIRGTPTMIIGDALVPGAIDFATMQKLVEKARTSCKLC